MKIKVGDKLAEKVKKITVDGKPVVLWQVMELDTEKGWVKMDLPKVLPVLEATLPDADNLSEDDKEQMSVAETKWEEKILYGKVEVEFDEEEDATT